MRERPDVLFLCVANSARSQLAEGWARRLAPPGVGVHSAGSAPGAVHPVAVEVMAEVGIDISSQRSKPISEIPLERIGTVVTLCDDEVCPILDVAVERLHWPLPDPAQAAPREAQLAAFRRTRDRLEARIRERFAG